MPTYRVRKCCSLGGGKPQFYFHADIIARRPSDALKAARQGKVLNWRRVDCYDWSEDPYESHFLLYRVHDSEARNPAKPAKKGGVFLVDLPAEKREAWSSYLNPAQP